MYFFQYPLFIVNFLPPSVSFSLVFLLSLFSGQLHCRIHVDRRILMKSVSIHRDTVRTTPLGMGKTTVVLQQPNDV